MVWTNLNLEEAIHRKAKAISATRGIPLKDYLAELIREGVAKEDRDK